MRTSAIVVALVFIWCPPIAILILALEFYRSRKEQQVKIEQLQAEIDDANLTDEERAEAAAFQRQKLEDQEEYRKYMQASAAAREHAAREEAARGNGPKLFIDAKGNYFWDTPAVGGIMRMDAKGRTRFVKT